MVHGAATRAHTLAASFQNRAQPPHVVVIIQERGGNEGHADARANTQRCAQDHAGSDHFLLLREQVPPPADVASNKQQRFDHIHFLQTLEALCETQSPPITAQRLVAEALITEPSLTRTRLSLSRHAG